MLFLVLLLLCVILVFVKFTTEGDFWLKRNVIHEKGVLWSFITGNCSLAEIYKNIYDKYPKEPYVGIYAGVTPALVIRDLKNVQAVMSSDFQSFNSRGIVTNPRDVLADNILFMDHYPRWKLMRQKLSPVFTSARLKNMFYILERCARDFVEMTKKMTEMREKPFNALYTYSTASIGASVFGIDTNLGNTMESPYLDMAWKSLNPTVIGNLKFVLANISVKLFNFLNVQQFGQFKKFFVGAMKKVLSLRRQDNEKRNDFIDLCLELQNSGTMRDAVTNYEMEPTDEILAAQAFFFFIAGADTSANTMHFTLLELSNHPDILTKVHEELDKVFDECNENITYNEIEKLSYLDQVINEAMRKYPPIGLMQRKCTKETTLPIGNIKVEKDVLVVVPTFALHRDEKYFPDPETFDPNRFAPEHVLNIKKFSYLPFGEGNRICIGIRFARLQVKAGLAWLLRKYTLRAQNFTPDRFEMSFFSIRAPDAHYDLIARDISS